MSTLAMTKSIARFVVGTSVAASVGSIIKNNVEPENTIQKIEVVVGAFVLGSMAADHAKTYTDRTIDSVAEWYTNLKSNQS